MQSPSNLSFHLPVATAMPRSKASKDSTASKDACTEEMMLEWLVTRGSRPDRRWADIYVNLLEPEAPTRNKRKKDKKREAKDTGIMCTTDC